MIYKIIILIISLNLVIATDLESSYKNLLISQSKNENSDYLYYVDFLIVVEFDKIF